MSKTRKIMAVGILVAGVTSAKTPLHKNCVSDGFSFKSGLLILHTAKKKKPELYLFYNHNQTALLLTHPHRRRGASAGWDSLLKPGHASAILVDRPNFVFRCARMKKNYSLSPADCARVLNVCRYSKITIKNPQLTGSFWVGEDQPIKDLFRIIEKRGIELSSSRHTFYYSLSPQR